MADPPTPPPIPSPPRQARDWTGAGGLALSLLALVSCVPWLAFASGLWAWAARRSARANGRRTALSTAAIWIAATAFVSQVAAWQFASNWLAPALQRREVDAIKAAIDGRNPDQAAASNPLFQIARAPEPDPSSIKAFATRVRAELGELRGVSTLNESISSAGSAFAPVVTMALVLNFERGSATGAATVQRLAASEAEAQQSWLPSVHLLELEITMPDGSIAHLQPAPQPATSEEPVSAGAPSQTPHSSSAP